MTGIFGKSRIAFSAIAGAIALIAAPLSAQVETFDPDAAFSGEIDGDLAPVTGSASQPEPAVDGAAPTAAESDAGASPAVAPEWTDPTQGDPGVAASAESEAAADSKTYAEDDLIGAAEGVFGKGAEGLARMIEKMLADQGEPNAYIVGREAGGAFVVGARYGSGTLHHKVEGERKVYWTGPSIGFDAGANAANTFVLVYNLYDSEELFERYPAGEGQLYVVGGLNASYMRKGNVVLIPIRMGAGLRLGVNAGYMKFSKKQRWLPF
ncbi:DUF1134 domain-containing protein [Altererythrobacter arenosus]|uniref:DUF1134 domain-containing protein n=1 Tax=Altererythrobacter arenosus TaxID=3032592 RepID=A0ABY8FTX7_9SPHN|nr:DUF1134 domain-containing protein [Altererythrobacter sp. CAU 1644]WFL78217.1 DUF1134 domain-containing protein [Altererythrobacter sp. CAU 1644]